VSKKTPGSKYAIKAGRDRYLKEKAAAKANRERKQRRDNDNH